MLVEQIAHVAYEANRAYSSSIGEEPKTPWNDLPRLDRLVYAQAVTNVQSDATPETQHYKWMLSKQQAGWRHGRKLDPIAKTHPQLMPYTELPAEQKVKDKLFLAIVKALKGVGN